MKEEPWLKKVLEDAKFCYSQLPEWAKDMKDTTTTAVDNLVFVPFPDNNPYLTAQNGVWINPETQRIEWNWCGSKCVGYTIKPIDKTPDNKDEPKEDDSFYMPNTVHYRSDG